MILSFFDIYQIHLVQLEQQVLTNILEKCLLLENYFKTLTRARDEG